MLGIILACIVSACTAICTVFVRSLVLAPCILSLFRPTEMFWGPSWEFCTLTLHRYLFCLPIVIFTTHYGPTFLQGVSQCLRFPHLVWVMGVYTLNSQMKQKRPQCANGCLVQKTRLELHQSKTSKWCAAQASCLSTKSWSPVTPPFWLNQIQPSVTNPDSSPT